MADSKGSKEKTKETTNGNKSDEQEEDSGCRIDELSRPKQFQFSHINENGPKVQWGTQDMLWPVTSSTLNFSASHRVLELATPKRNFQAGNRDPIRPEFKYSCGRSSAVWEVSPRALQANPSPRVNELALPRMEKDVFTKKAIKNHYYGCGRESPLWKPSSAAKSASAGERTTDLAQFKELPKEFQPNRYQVETIVPEPAKKTTPSPRVTDLAKPKPRDDYPHRHPQWEVSELARKGNPSARVIELSHHKHVPETYRYERNAIWKIPKGAKTYSATTRIDELSVPIVRATLDHILYDPNSFTVKETALKARCSKRMEELAQPIQR